MHEHDTTVVRQRRLGLVAGMRVAEIGWRPEVDELFRRSVAELTGAALLEPGAGRGSVVDVVLVWWRTGDGDLLRVLGGARSALTAGGSIWVLTPKPGLEHRVDPVEIESAATALGLHRGGGARSAPVDRCAVGPAGPAALTHPGPRSGP